MTLKRKRNTPKKYPNTGTGQGKNPRPKCAECGRSMYKPQIKITNDVGKREAIHPIALCKCGHVDIDYDELKKIPD
jgi:hypothetical protein